MWWISLGWVSQLVVLVLLGLGCSAETEEPCLNGDRKDCNCIHGGTGSRTCQGDGLFGQCECQDPCLTGEIGLCSCPNGLQSQRSCQLDGFYTACMCAGLETCAQGVTSSCNCSDGSLSMQTCDATGVFSACACGDMGSGGAGGDTMPPPGTPGNAIAEPMDPAAFLWDQSQLRSYEITVSQANLDTIDNAPAMEQYVEASLSFEGVSYPIGLRYKGSIGGYVGCVSGGGGFNPLDTSGRKTCSKLSMKAKFNWMMDGERFFGLKKLQFHSMNSDDSMMRDRLGYALFRQMGIAGPRAVHARLVINGRFAGLFVNVEQIDSRFTRAHFSDGGDGNLYKEVWPKWTNAGDYMAGLRTNESDVDLSYDRIVRFAQAIQAAPGPTETLGVVGQWMDPNYVFKFIAVDRTILHDDGMFHWYCSGGLISVSTGNNPGPCSNHNYYWYEGQGVDQLWLVPWDLDLIFGGNSFTTINNAWNDPNPSCPSGGVSGSGGSPNQMPPACDKMTQAWASDPAGYKAALQQFLSGPFAQAAVDAQLNAWSNQISAAVNEQNQTFGSGTGTPSGNSWQSELSSLRSSINSRRSTMQQRAN